MFGRATIRLGIGPHSSFQYFGKIVTCSWQFFEFYYGNFEALKVLKKLLNLLEMLSEISTRFEIMVIVTLKLLVSVAFLVHIFCCLLVSFLTAFPIPSRRQHLIIDDYQSCSTVCFCRQLQAVKAVVTNRTSRWWRKKFLQRLELMFSLYGVYCRCNNNNKWSK